MAYDSVRAMMDSLMGADRDSSLEEKEKNKRAFDDPTVDTLYLCGCSPYLLLSDTKSSDLIPGSWNKIQDVTLKNDWTSLPQEEKDKYGYERDLMEVCARLVGQMDARITSNKAKIASETQLEPEHQAEVNRMDGQINDLQTRAELAGEEGDVDASTQMIGEASQVKAARDAYEAQHKPKARRDFVCPVSGVIYSSGDQETQMRVEEGRQYRAWKEIRDKLIELQAQNGGEGPPKATGPPPRSARRADDRGRSDRSPRRDRDRDRVRDRDRDSRRDRERSRSRDRRRERRSRSRERRDSRRDSRRSKSRDRRR